MSGPEELPDGQCVCGRDLPEDPLSDWACSEPCQSAWLHWHADPDVYPHPREIRAAAEARAATIRPDPAGLRRGQLRPDLVQVADGTAIDVDGQRYVRRGAHWEPAGTWSPLRSELADLVRYRRWCPHCRERRATMLYPADDTQACEVCDHRWQGRPLLGVVETRGAPWPGLRLRLTDGQRSASFFFDEAAVMASAGAMPAMIERCWQRLERKLCGGLSDADADVATASALARAGARVDRSWHAPRMAVDLTRPEP